MKQEDFHLFGNLLEILGKSWESGLRPPTG
jgi:hypothetical protein